MNMARRRGNNEGSIFKRKDDRWVGEVSLNGRRLTKYAKTQKECRDWVNQTLGMIFTTSIGTYIDQTKVSCAFKQVLREANLPDIRFHDLRHTSISILLDNGTPVNTVQSRAGHSKASVTADIYGHAMARSQQQAARMIEEIVKPLTNELLSD
jgi:integrase